MDKKQRNSIMRSRNKKPLSQLTGGDYYHKQDAHTILKLLGWAFIAAMVVCIIIEVVK